MSDPVEIVREQDRKRREWERQNAIRLRGSDAAAQAVRANWTPLQDAIHDLNRPPEPDEPITHDRTRWSYGEDPDDLETRHRRISGRIPVRG